VGCALQFLCLILRKIAIVGSTRGSDPLHPVSFFDFCLPRFVQGVCHRFAATVPSGQRAQITADFQRAGRYPPASITARCRWRTDDVRADDAVTRQFGTKNVQG
jgi:hypothetical protein